MTSHEFQSLIIPRKRTIRRRHTESSMQAACVAWFRTQYPKLAKNLFAIPNGGSRAKKQNKKGKWYSPEAIRMRKEGVLEGVPDLFLAKEKDVDTKRFGVVITLSGMFIEMKIAPNKPSREQLEMIALFRSEGYYCCVCYSIDEFIKEVRGYLG